MNETLRKIIADAINVDPSEVTPDSTSEDFEHWDSLAQVMMLSEVQGTFGVDIPFELMAKVSCVKDIIELVGE